MAPMGQPHRWPRQSVDPRMWRWRVVVQHAWKDAERGEHINKLELRSKLAALKWRLRAASNVYSRGVHLMDSMVSLGLLAHGRTSSRDLCPVMERIAALLLAGSVIPLYGHCKSATNNKLETMRQWKQRMRQWQTIVFTFVT